MSRSISADEIKYLAKTAARAYLDGQQALDDAVVKIARENGLNPHQTCRVIETANSAVYAGLRKTAEAEGKPLTFEFDVARPETVFDKLGFEKTAEVLSEGRRVAHILEYEYPPAGALLKAAAEAGEREAGAHDREEHGEDDDEGGGDQRGDTREEYLARRGKQRQMAKVGSLVERLKGESSMHEMAHRALVSGLVKHAGSMLLEGRFRYPTLHAAALSSVTDSDRAEVHDTMMKVGHALLDKNRISHQDLAKAASMEVGDSWKSEALPPGSVVNGTHQFFKTLDTAVQSRRVCSEFQRDLVDINKDYDVGVNAAES